MPTQDTSTDPEGQEPEGDVLVRMLDEFASQTGTAGGVAV